MDIRPAISTGPKPVSQAATFSAPSLSERLDASTQASRTSSRAAAISRKGGSGGQAFGKGGPSEDFASK